MGEEDEDDFFEEQERKHHKLRDSEDSYLDMNTLDSQDLRKRIPANVKKQETLGQLWGELMNDDDDDGNYAFSFEEASKRSEIKKEGDKKD